VVELQEFGGYVLSDDNSLGGATLPKSFGAAADAMGKLGMDIRVGNKIGELLGQAGWKHIAKRVITMPIAT